jgi:integrase
MEFWKKDLRLWSQHITDMTSKDKFKKAGHISLWWFNSIQVRKTGTTQLESCRIERTKITQQLCRAERSLRIGNIHVHAWRHTCTCCFQELKVYQLQSLRFKSSIEPTFQHYNFCLFARFLGTKDKI